MSDFTIAASLVVLLNLVVLALLARRPQRISLSIPPSSTVTVEPGPRVGEHREAA